MGKKGRRVLSRFKERGREKRGEGEGNWERRENTAGHRERMER